jgi:hypothetical protein
LNASKFEEISKSSGSSSIASFFAKKESEDAEIQKQSFAQKNEIKTSADSYSNGAITTNPETTDVSYVRNEIDKSIMNELPDDIQNEIKQFLGVSSKTSERVKRTSNGIQKYAVSQSVNDTKLTQQSRSTAGNTNTEPEQSAQKYDDIGEGTRTVVKPSDSTEFARCSKCGQQISKSKMDEHTDFHFAFELQKRSGISLDSMQTEEPPKKKQKGTISKFFVPKGR